MVRQECLIVLGWLLGFAFACSSDSAECPSGSEGCRCTADYRCLSGLMCLSDYCVDPGSGTEGGVTGGSSSDHDNVAACEEWIDTFECAGFDLSEYVDCGIYDTTVCDLAEYFDCLTDNTDCSGGVLDMSGWTTCMSLASCD